MKVLNKSVCEYSHPMRLLTRISSYNILSLFTKTYNFFICSYIHT